MRKRLAVLLCILLVLPVFGCSKKDEVKCPKIIVWHWMSDRIDVLEELAKEYKKATAVDVKYELYAPTPAYTSKIRVAAQASKLPDIYGVLLEMWDYASLINAGHVADLTPCMEENNGEWKSRFCKGAFFMDSFSKDNQYAVKPGIYGVPIEVNNIQFIYNLTLLKKAGWNTDKLPETWSEFIALGDAMKEAGIPGLVSGWGEPWMIHCMADNFAWNIMGKDKIIATIKGEVPYTDPDWIVVFDLFKQMKDHGLLCNGIVTMINKEAEQTFANERAAIAFNGSWCVNVYESMNPDLKYAVALPPRVNLKNPAYIWGGTTSFVVSEKSPMKEDAIQFLKWLTTEKEQCYLAQKTLNMPANKNSSNVLSGPIAQFARGIDNVVHPRLLPVEEFPLVTEAFDKGIQSIIIGEATPLSVANMVQGIKEGEARKAAIFKAIKDKDEAKNKKP